MSLSRLRTAVVGLGRIGQVHARNLLELAAQGVPAEVVAIVEPLSERRGAAARLLSDQQGATVRAFASVGEMLAATEVEAAVVCSTTAHHEANARALVEAGCRVLLEKPLTDSPRGDRDFARFLDDHHPDALMLAFQRRFDAPLRWVRELVDAGRIGRPFKFVSILEDSKLMPPGYQTPGLLRDMSIHNVDELLWLSGQRAANPRFSGSRLYSQALTEVREDFDDALLQFQLGTDAIGQVQVSRNHVAGYRCETWVYGELGFVHVGGFQPDVTKVAGEAYGPEGTLERRVFPLPLVSPDAPEFVARFLPAYAEELDVFLQHVAGGTAFPVNQQDGLRATELLEDARPV